MYTRQDNLGARGFCRALIFLILLAFNSFLSGPLNIVPSGTMRKKNRKNLHFVRSLSNLKVGASRKLPSFPASFEMGLLKDPT